METSIPLKARFILFGIIGSLLIGTFALWVFVEGAASLSKPFNIIVQILMALIGIIAFPNAIMGMRKLFGQRTGFVIGDEGIRDNTVSSSVSTFAWHEIRGFRMDVAGPSQVPVIAVDLVDSDIYMHGVNGVRKKILNSNINTFGTPVVIRPTLLDIDPLELMRLLETRLEAHRSGTTNG